MQCKFQSLGPEGLANQFRIFNCLLQGAPSIKNMGEKLLKEHEELLYSLDISSPRDLMNQVQIL